MNGGTVFLLVLVAFCNSSLAALYVYLRRKGRLWGAAAGRWHELAAEDARDPALRRCAAVKDAYLAGEFGPDELEWRILLAFMPPVPRPAAPWTKTDGLGDTGPGGRCSFHELHSGSGYFGAFCVCGHDMNQHYNGGCHDCDVARCVTCEADPSRASEHVSQFPRPEMQEIGKPPEAPLPTDADPRLVDHRHW